jgi:hypothetical protein
VRATESPKSRTFTGGPAAVAGGAVVLVVDEDDDDDPVLPTPPGKAVLATADVPVVAAITATTTAPTPAGTTSHARHWLMKVPIRIGRSTRWKDTTETAKVTTTRNPKSS